MKLLYLLHLILGNIWLVNFHKWYWQIIELDRMGITTFKSS